ncbi:MAG: hypothetical protein H6566_19970 [Lewinellaceae bacterium]|nr:hypothetical protein [Lewinellaceae bacterium]
MEKLVLPKRIFEACSYCKSRTYDPRLESGQALTSLLIAYLARQTRKKAKPEPQLIGYQNKKTLTQVNG